MTNPHDPQMHEAAHAVGPAGGLLYSRTANLIWLAT